MKKIIAVAIAALPMAAMADVEIYGQLEASVETGKAFGYSNPLAFDNAGNVTGHNGAALKNSNTRIDDTGSKIGFKGTEDLGNGLKAIWQVESYLSVDGTNVNGGGRANQFAGRDSFVGLQGNWGKVRLGRLSTYQNDSMEKFDPWTYGVGVNGMTWTSANNLDGRIDNAVRYDTPNLNGFKAAILYGTDEQRVEINGNRSNRSTWNIGAGYEYAGYYVDAGYTLWQDANALGDKDANYWRLEGGYAANNLLVALAYGQAKTYDGSQFAASLNLPSFAVIADDTAAIKSKEVALTVAYTMGNFTPRFSYARVFDVTRNGHDASEWDVDQYVLGLDYTLSKRTMAYVSYGYASHDSQFKTVFGDDKEQTFALGLVHKF